MKRQVRNPGKLWREWKLVDDSQSMREHLVGAKIRKPEIEIERVSHRAGAQSASPIVGSLLSCDRFSCDFAWLRVLAIDVGIVFMLVVCIAAVSLTHPGGAA